MGESSSTELIELQISLLQAELVAFQVSFRVLNGWILRAVRGSEYACHATIHPTEPRAEIYLCTDWDGKGSPAGYALHEVMHVAFRAAQQLGRVGEELLVQDLCQMLEK